MESTGTCRLCGKKSKLIEAHIIPDFLYNDVKGDHGKIVSLDLTNNKHTVLNRGIFDRKILCAKCDNDKLGRLDNYASFLLKSKIYPLIANVDKKFGVREVHEIVIDDVDYKQMKLFILSVLWRSQVTDRDFFKAVKIENLDSIIKKMLIEDDPGEENIFQIAMFSLIDVIGKPMPIILTPKVIKFEHLHVCIFVMGGIAYLINLGENLLSRYKSYALKKTNKLTVQVLSGIRANRELRAWGIPESEANFFTYRILSIDKNVIVLAREGHFDILINFYNCSGKQPRITMEIAKEFGLFDNSLASHLNRRPQERMGQITHKTIPLSLKGKKEMVIVNAYVKINNGANVPFNLTAFKSCLRQINARFKGADVGMTNIWKGFVGWDVDHDKVLSILDEELPNCRVKIAVAPET